MKIYEETVRSWRVIRVKTPTYNAVYKFFKYNGKSMDIIDYDPEILLCISDVVI